MKITKIFTVALAVVAAVSCAPKKTATEELPVALQLYSVRGDLQEDFLGTLCKVSEIGYDGVEFAGLYGYEPAQIKHWCDSLGLVPVSAHVPLAEMFFFITITILNSRNLKTVSAVLTICMKMYRQTFSRQSLTSAG